MAQITIYLEDEVLALVRAATKETGISKSKWVAEAVRQRAKKEWPPEVVAAAGSWADFPTAEEIRNGRSADTPRENL